MTNISDRHEYPSRDPGRAREHDRASRQTPHLVRGVAAHGMRVVDAPREIVVSDVEEFWDAIQARDTNPASGPMPMRIRVEWIRVLPAPDFSRVADIHRFDSYGRPHAAIDVRNVDFGHVTLTGDWRNCVFKGSIFAHATLGGAFHAPFLADATVNGLQDRLFNDKRIAGNA